MRSRPHWDLKCNNYPTGQLKLEIKDPCDDVFGCELFHEKDKKRI